MAEQVGARILHLTKRYGTSIAVQDVDLEVKKGEFFTLLGPSGCGKTTILMCIAGLMDHDEGEIEIEGKVVTSKAKRIFIPPGERNIGMVFQDYALYPHLKVFDNIAFPLQIKNLDKNEISQRVEKVAKLLEIETFLNRKPHELSGGQRQRVAIGRAIVKEPAIFLFDEPLANLDAQFRVTARVELKKLQRRLNATVVCVTHDQLEAMSISDRICVLKDGKVQQIGIPYDVYSKPKNIFVAGFIGSPPMNLKRCRMEKSDHSLTFDFLNHTLEIPKNRIQSDKIPDSVTIGIRPEHIKIANKTQGINAIKGEIILIESLPPNYYLHVAVGTDELTCLTPSIDENVKVDGGITLELDVNSVHIFDDITGNSLMV